MKFGMLRSVASQANVFPSLPILTTLMKEALSSSETPGSYKSLTA
jgi:hypothetical protein